MEQGTRHTRRWRQIAIWVLLTLFALLLGFLATANFLYYSPQAADLPCRNCSGDARAVQVGGFDLYYRELGTSTTKSPIVVLHGGPGHSSQSFKRSLDFLAQEYHVIYYDQRGSGNSQIKPDPAAYTIEQLVEELDALRRDVIGADKITLIAHSAGGALAQRYALAHSDHVESMILIGSIRINNNISAPLVWDLLVPGLSMLGGFPPADPEAANDWYGQQIVDGSIARLYNPENRSLVEDSGYFSFATWREVSRSLEGKDFSKDLSRLPVRTLVIYGAADNSFTGKDTATSLCALLPDCKLVEFPFSGHWPFLEEQQSFAQTVTTFLAAKQDP
jgi:proline iminopeptidase